MIEAAEQKNAQLFVCVKETKKLSIETSGAFCILQLDKQQVKTRTAPRSTNTEFSYDGWDEGFTFDVSNQACSFFISIYGTNSESGANSDGIFLGQLTIPVKALSHEKPVDQWFKLSSNKPGKEIPGELHIKLHQTTTINKITVDDFQPLMVVGKGTFAKVMMVQKKDTGRLYAMKIINKDAVFKHNAVKHTMAERNVLRKINHPFIVSLKYSFQTEDKLYMILDYINGGELFYHLSDAERFDEERARFYSAEIVLALGYLHSLNIVYRDLKPENLLLDMNGNICLTDFGLCKENLGYGNVTHTFCGSPEYLAPEIFLGNGYDKSVDWWALGTLLYEMLSGLPPFFSDDLEVMNQKILSEPLWFPDYFSADAQSLLKQLLERNPKKRLGNGQTDAEEIKRHPFFKSIDWNKLDGKQIEPPFRPPLRSETDTRFFDPESTQMVARHSFSECHLTSKEQEAFKGFSYVAPDAHIYYWPSRRRGSSGRGSNNSSPNASPIPAPRRVPPTTNGLGSDAKILTPKERPQKDFLSKHRAESE